MINVFLSSTGVDLKRCRELIFDIINHNEGLHCIRMEDFGAMPGEPLENILQMIDKSDLFIGLIGFHYGNTPPGEEKSFTQLEYQAASEKPKLMFVATEDYQTPAGIHENDQKWTLQQKFRDKVKSDDMVEMFSSTTELTTHVATAIANWRSKKLPVDAGTTNNDNSREVSLKAGPITWTFRNFLGMTGIQSTNGENFRISAFQASAINTSDQFIKDINGFVRSKISGEHFPMLLNANGNLVDPIDTAGIPPKCSFYIGVPFTKPWTDYSSFHKQLTKDEFLQKIGDFVFFCKYHNGQIEKGFSLDEISETISDFQK